MQKRDGAFLRCYAVGGVRPGAVELREGVNVSAELNETAGNMAVAGRAGLVQRRVVGVVPRVDVHVVPLATPTHHALGTACIAHTPHPYSTTTN